MMKYNYLLSVLLFVTLLPLTPLHSDELKTQASNQDYRGLKICEAPCRCFGEPLNPVRADLQRLIEDVEKYENEMRRMKKINQSLVSRLAHTNLELEEKIRKQELELQKLRK